MKVISNAKPKYLPKPRHSDWVFTRTFVYEQHGLKVISFHVNTFVCPSGALAAGGDKDGKQLQEIDI